MTRGRWPEPRLWSWGGDADSHSVEVTGALISWTDLVYDDRLGDVQHNGRTQSVDDFRGYGPPSTGTPPEVVAGLAEHLGVVDPGWARPVPPEVADLISRAQRGDIVGLQGLSSAGADLDVADAQGHTPLWWAIARRHDDTALALISAGADVRRLFRYGQDLLMVAAAGGGPPVIRALLAGGLSPSSVDTLRGATALTDAVERGQTEDVVRMLVQAGADVDHRLPDGRTPLSMAERRGRPEIVRLLLQAGATPIALQG